MDKLFSTSRLDGTQAKSEFCFGFCSDVGHEIARVEALVDVHHDHQGRPTKTLVSKSSGHPLFDKQALSAVQQAFYFGDSKILGGTPVPRFSQWIFRSIAYRWGRAELILDPTFEPPGRTLKEDSGFLGKTTVVKEVRLLLLDLYE